MSNDRTHLPPPLDLSGWRRLPAVLMVAGGLLSGIGAWRLPTEFGYSWLLAFMFYYSIALGALFLVMVHHLTDAGWSVGIRRFCEHLASLLFPWLAVLFLPVLIFSRKIYSWLAVDPAVNNSVAAKWAGLHLFRLHRHLGGFLRHLVAALIAVEPLVAQAG